MNRKMPFVQYIKIAKQNKNNYKSIITNKSLTNRQE